MGDILNLITWPQHQHVFYKITSGAIAFSVRGERHAAVGLAKKPGEKCEYWIVIGHNQCWVEREGTRNSNHKDMPNLLSNDVFNKFWISWHRSRLQFGSTSDGVPLISKKISVTDLQYVTFSVFTDRGTSQWKLILPPKIKKTVLKKVKGGDLEWSDLDNYIPEEALIGGYENELLYIIRAQHRGSLTPGKYVPSQRLGFIPWGGGSHEKSEFEVLCGFNCIWVSTFDNKIPVGAVEGGYSEETHETLYIGRATQDGYLIPGKVQPSHSVCYISYNNKEIAKQNYEILINPESSMHSPNHYFVPHMGYVSEIRTDEPDEAYMNVYWDQDDDNTESE